LTLALRFSIERLYSAAVSCTCLAAEAPRSLVLLQRLQTTRSRCAALARVAALVVSLGMTVGCQNNSERDLIARDRRMQEDQIYALQDYINQYQRLLCQYRSENASLRRQLSGSYTTVVPQAAEPEPPSVLRSGSPQPSSTPQFKTPETPGVKQQQLPATPSIPDITPPDVPPLKSTTDDAPDRESNHVASEERKLDSAPKVVQASYDAPASGPQTQMTASADNASWSSRLNSVSDLMIAGEVVENNSGGPRLMIDVVPFDSNGQVKAFEGSASIMLLEIDENGKQHSRGRWDYSRDDVRAAINTATGKPTMRYFIELPPNTRTGGPVQVWVRLVPQTGAKLLSHASVDMTKPGVFSSRPEKRDSSTATKTSVVAASYSEDTPNAGESSTSAPEINTTNTESAWVVAQPGKPAILPPETSDTSGAGGWRTSAQSIPAFVASSTDAAPVTANPTPAPLPRREIPAAAEAPPRRPSWSSDRSSDSARKDVTRPSWSATR